MKFSTQNVIWYSKHTESLIVKFYQNSKIDMNENFDLTFDEKKYLIENE